MSSTMLTKLVKDFCSRVSHFLASSLVSIEPTLWLVLVGTRKPAGFAELRAVYGGLEIALGIFLVVTGFRANWSGIGLWLLLSCYGGITAGRIAGILLDHPDDTFTLQLLGFEAGSLLITILLVFGLKRRS